MADISQIKLPDNTVLDIKDVIARTMCPYDIGDIYVTTIDYANATGATNGDPSDKWPDTYWEAIHGRFLVAEGNNGSEGSDALNITSATGGAATVTLTAEQSGVRDHYHNTGTHYHSLNNHTHTGPSHTHGASSGTHFLYRNADSGTQTRSAVGTSGSAYTWRGTTAGGFGSGTDTASGGTGNTGTPSNNSTGNATRAADGSGTPTTSYVQQLSTLNNQTTAHENLPPYLAVFMWKRIPNPNS